MCYCVNYAETNLNLHLMMNNKVSLQHSVSQNLSGEYIQYVDMQEQSKMNLEVFTSNMNLCATVICQTCVCLFESLVCGKWMKYI